MLEVLEEVVVMPVQMVVIPHLVLMLQPEVAAVAAEVVLGQTTMVELVDLEVVTRVEVVHLAERVMLVTTVL